MAKRPYRSPEVKTKDLALLGSPVLLACTGQVDCGDFGFAAGCCVPLDEEALCGDNC